MPHTSSSECSTEFEVSGSVASASASTTVEAYEDEEFDAYSDSFESDNDDAGGDRDSVSASNRTELNLLSIGGRVQVFWRDENAWFDGVVQRVDDGDEPRYFVHYDDGEQQWEDPSSIRPLPVSLTSTSQYDQLQQLLPLSKQTAVAIAGLRAIVFWPDESKWYNGTVSSVQASPPALKIEYDDGDSRWEQEHSFNCILLERATSDLPPPPASGLVTSAPLPLELVLYARPYRHVVSDHFQPVRMARPYRCAVEKHSESIIIPRRYRFLLQPDKDDSATQTTVSPFLSESA